MSTLVKYFYSFIMKTVIALAMVFIGLFSSAQESTIVEQEVGFENEGINFAGTLYRPNKSNAAVVLVHGSGQEKRMRKFALRLAAKGITVFTYDKRGVGESQGVYVGPEVGTNNIDAANLKLLASDARKASEKLAQLVNNKNMPIGLMGFSQAGWIIPLAATNNKDVDFMVIFSGALVPTLEQLRFQFYTAGNTNFWDQHTEEEAREHMKNDPDRYQFETLDPRLTLKELNIPGLWLFGAKDIQIPAKFSLEELEKFKAEKKFDSRWFPAYGHHLTSSSMEEPVNEAVEWIKNIKPTKKK